MPDPESAEVGHAGRESAPPAHAGEMREAADAAEQRTPTAPAEPVAAGSVQVRRGLVGVVADTTAISKVNPETNSLLYRGYPVQELAASCSFEQVAFLLWDGDLPDDGQLADLEGAERGARPLDPTVRAAIDLLPLTAHPMDVVRTAVSVIGAIEEAPQAIDPLALRDKSVRLLGAIPGIVAYDQRRRRGQPEVEPDASLDWSTDFLRRTFGAVPDPVVVDAFRVSMVLYAEHSFNASTFTARVVASTLSDLHSAVVAAIGALKGPLHGGANEAVMHVIEEIGSPDAVDAWVQRAFAEKRKIMGFGHRVYKNGDSRVPTMRAALDRLLEHEDRRDLGELLDRLQRAVGDAKNIKPNLDYPSGPAYALMGFDIEFFTPLFVAARVVGWTAHIAEQLSQNALIRPLSEYVGPPERHLPA